MDKGLIAIDIEAFGADCVGAVPQPPNTPTSAAVMVR